MFFFLLFEFFFFYLISYMFFWSNRNRPNLKKPFGKHPKSSSLGNEPITTGISPCRPTTTGVWTWDLFFPEVLEWAIPVSHNPWGPLGGVLELWYFRDSQSHILFFSFLFLWGGWWTSFDWPITRKRKWLNNGHSWNCICHSFCALEFYRLSE